MIVLLFHLVKILILLLRYYWLIDNMLSLHAGKTEFILFGKKNSFQKLAIFMLPLASLSNPFPLTKSWSASWPTSLWWHYGWLDSIISKVTGGLNRLQILPVSSIKNSVKIFALLCYCVNWIIAAPPGSLVLQRPTSAKSKSSKTKWYVSFLNCHHESMLVSTISTLWIEANWHPK